MNKMRHCDLARIKHLKEMRIVNLDEDEIIAYADRFLSGILSFDYNFDEIVRYNPHRLGNLDLEHCRLASKNSFMLHALGLRQVYILARAFLTYRNESYLELSEDFVRWLHAYMTRYAGQNGMLDNSHTLSERIENLVYLYSVAQENDYPLKCADFIVDMVDDAVNKLLYTGAYQRRHNQGIIADKAALTGLYFLDRDDMNEKISYVLDRLKAQVEYAYNAAGVHRENSFDYHVSISSILLGCEEILKILDHPHKDVLTAYLDKANEFVIYALKPNLSYPLFGDSKGFLTQLDRSNHSITIYRHNTSFLRDNAFSEYIATKGKAGRRPTKRLACFQSEYLFFREHFDAEDFENATWMSFKAGYTTRTHKHRDDLSITLYSKGHDIFVDAGMYNYMPGNPIKDYMESIPAHTTVAVRDLPYSVASGNGEKLRIQEYGSTPDYDYALASSRAYENTAIYRLVCYLRARNVILIRDRIRSDEARTYAQYFHLSSEVALGACGADEARVAIGDTGYEAVLRQLRPVDEVSVLDGLKTRPISVLSTGFGSYVETKTLAYTKRGRDCEFITLVEIKEEGATETPVEISEDGVSIGGVLIPENRPAPVEFTGVEIAADGAKITVSSGDRAGVKAALYVYGRKEGPAIGKIPYTEEKEIAFDNARKEDVILLYYLANGKGELIKGVVGECRYRDGTAEVTNYYVLHHPAILGRTCRALDDGGYEFAVDVSYRYPAVCTWWVYYNGSVLECDNNDKYLMTYRFDQPGEYVVMYSFRDRLFGEFAFDQFKRITVQP